MRFRILLLSLIVLAGVVGAGFAIAASPPPSGEFTCLPSCSVVAGATVTFSATSNAATPSYSWDLAGDQPPDFSQAEGPTVSRTYPKPGSYQIALEITDVATKQSSIVTHTLIVTAPTTDFTCSPSCSVTAGGVVTFTATSDALTPSYGWSFSGGGGFTDAIGATAKEAFDTPGTFTVGVQVTDSSSGLTATATHQVTVVAAGPSAAPTSLIETFDDYPTGAIVRSDAGGVSFPQGPSIALLTKIRAASGSTALEAPAGAGNLQICFADPARTVSLDVGFDDHRAPAGGTWARIIADDTAGKPIASAPDVQVAAAGHFANVVTALRVTTSGYQIGCVRVFIGAGTASHDTGARRPLIDNLIVPTTLNRPSISIHTPADGSTFRADAAPRNATGTAYSPRGFQNLCLVVTQSGDPATPPDWTRCPNPNVIPGHRGPLSPDGSFTLSLAPLPAGTDHITAWVRAADGQTAHDTVTIVVTPAPVISDLRVTAMEITQGIQTSQLSTVASLGTHTVPYTGVELVSNRTTWVRVWADTDGATARAVPALLHLYGSHGELPGSPLTADGGPMTLTAGSVLFDQTLRGRLGGEYLFTVPAAMIHDTVSFRAEVDPDPGAVTECASCLANDTLEVSGVHFTPVQTQLVTPIELFDTVNPGDHPAADPFDDFDPARQAYPFPIAMIVPYQAQIDMTSTLQDPTINPTDLEGQLLGLVGNLERDNSFPGHTIGISGLGGPAGLTSAPTFFCCDPIRVERVAMVNEQRPLTSVAHEFGHVMGLAHASTDCGGGANGQPAADWPPDQHGLIQGVGFDPIFHGPVGAPFITYTPGTDPTPGTTVLDPGLSPHSRFGPSFTGPQSDYTNQWFDFMSYCADELPDNDSWISTHNWNALVDGNRAAAHASVAATAAPVNSVPGPGLEITAIVDKTPKILNVEPEASGVRGSVNSPYHIVLRNGSGTIVSDTGVSAGVTHIDTATGQPAVPIMLIDTVVSAPASAVAAQLTDNGTVIATKAASAHAPTVRFLTPGPRLRAKGTGTVAVTWSAKDADGDHLTSTLDYSADAGRHWRAIRIGMARDSIALPAHLLTRSNRARLRVTVSDGWHTTSAVSAVFRAAGNPPLPTIEEPSRPTTLRADAALSLVGQAFDETDRPIAGSRLTWRLGRTVLGHGGRLSARDLSAGRHTIMLQATDRGGRTGIAKVHVQVLAVAPIVTELKAPHTLGPRVRRLKIRLATSVAARLTLNHGKLTRPVSVSRRPITVTIIVPPGHTPLTLAMRLKTGRKTTRFTLTVAR